jgi:hypothetical protein
MAIMDSYDGDTGGFGVNQTYYGGADLANNARVGAYWSGMTPKQVLITRRNEDPAADLVRMRIWRLEYGLFLPVIKRSP